jgi:CRISPR-associated protein Csm2
MSIYFDGNGHMRKELLGDEADKVAETFVVSRHDGSVDGKSSVTSAQLRRFYNDMKSLEKKLKFKREGGEADPFLSILPLVKMIKSKVAYASSPRNPKIPQAFAAWLARNIDAIDSIEDFKAFLLHFEAVVGFCYGRGLSNS